MKRSVDEAFVSNDDSRSAPDDQTTKPSSRVSLISLSSSSSSFTTASAASFLLRQPATSDTPILDATKRSSSSITVTDDSDAPANSDDGFAGHIVVTTRLRNARILQRDGTLLPGSMDLSNGIVTAVSIAARDGEVEEDGTLHARHDNEVIEVIDCQNHILSSGYIDIQLNGAFGIDFSCHDGSNSECTSNNSTSDPTTSATTTRGGLEVQDILKVAQHLVRSGVTSFCPTMVSSSPQTYRRIIPMIRNARNVQQKERLQRNQQQRHKINIEGCNRGVRANILGMHLEGPFFASSKHGAHDLHHICAPIHGISTVKEVYGINNDDNTSKYDIGDDIPPSLEDIDIITLAPELPGAFDAIKSLTRFDNTLTSAPSSKTTTATTTTTHSQQRQQQLHSVVVSCGHTNATYDEGMQALMSGSTLITHLFNAMNPFHHRTPGLIGLLSSSSSTKLEQLGLTRPYYSLIVDGIHVHESAVSMAYQCHPRGCILVTDAMAAMGLGDGLHSLGNMKVCTKGDCATVAGTDTLAGSVVSMDTCVKRFRQFTRCTIGEALLCATLHPAMALKRHTATSHGGGSGGGGGINNDQGCAMSDAPIGMLEVGAKADVILLNEELDVLATWVGGQLAFRKGKGDQSNTN